MNNWIIFYWLHSLALFIPNAFGPRPEMTYSERGFCEKWLPGQVVSLHVFSHATYQRAQSNTWFIRSCWVLITTRSTYGAALQLEISLYRQADLPLPCGCSGEVCDATRHWSIRFHPLCSLYVKISFKTWTFFNALLSCFAGCSSLCRVCCLIITELYVGQRGRKFGIVSFKTAARPIFILAFGV